MPDSDTWVTRSLPLYRHVTRQILHALAHSEWAPGEVIPSEKQLCVRFGVSVGTLRKAIDELVTENILIRHEGRGTFVATHARNQHMFRFFNIVRQDNVKNYPSVQLIHFRHARADKLAAEKLRLAPRAAVIQFTNLLCPNDEPTLLDDITLPEALFAGMTEAQLQARPNTLYDFYQRSFGLNVIRIEERLRAAAAGRTHAGPLCIPMGAPLLQIHRLAFSYNDQVIEYRVSHVNTARYEYFRNEGS